MSKNINVNPAHYKVAGRERQGEDIAQHLQRQAFGQQRAEVERWQMRQRDQAPGWEDPAQPTAEPESAAPPKRRRATRSKPRRKTARARKTSATQRTAKQKTAKKRPAAKRMAKKTGSRTRSRVRRA